MVKENKVNVELIVPSVGKKYNILIPVNKTVEAKIKETVSNNNLSTE